MVLREWVATLGRSSVGADLYKRHEEVHLGDFLDSLEEQLLRELWGSPLEEVNLEEFVDSL